MAKAAADPASNPAAGRTTYAALEARLNLAFKDREMMERVCTHPSFAAAAAATEAGEGTSNERLQWIGKRVLNLYVGEHLAAKYPNMPVEMLQDVQHGSFGLSSLAEVGRHFGLQPALRWRSVAKEEDAKVGLTKVLGKAVQALVGAVYQEMGARAAQQFVQQHILARPVDTETVLQISNPRAMLGQLTRKKGLEFPVARILKETGRFTSSPVFIVGVFCGVKMVGMGFGSSLKMAEHRAAKDALLKHYAKEIKDIELPEPADSEVSFFAADASAAPATRQ
ncbi:54S ribosomal protein L3 mitochondrial [Coemansia nantahalensis]|uniref:54S ribosomal protein L3 mitochondrial n=1 Tax=Coemansia nantahalensis TaxID=2789366 RepID=A0ACC1K3R0_9FUNG|nr:54S ribosomal protein L3 mitochondrial [Coemansia nantahalensis]